MKITSNLPANMLQGTVNIKEKYGIDLSKKEKKFFAGIYPQNKTEIMEYHFYSKTGKMSGVHLGSNIDRRG